MTEDLKKRIEKLPDVFQKRFKKFILTKPDFLEKHGSYELTCCEEAVNIAKQLKTVENIFIFKNLSIEDKYKRVNFLNDGHSGNSFSNSLQLAYDYLNDPDSVIIQHGSLVHLVGCEEYGCPHPPPEYVIEMLSPEGQVKIRKIIADIK